MNKASIIIAASMLGSRILGVLREMLLAKIAGVNEQKNALDLAFMIPDILNHLIGTGFLSIVFISLFTTHLLRQNETEGWRAFSNIFNVLGFFLLLLTIPSFIFMRELILLLTAAPPSENILEMATKFGRIILPAQLFFFAGSFLIAAQQAKKQFFIPSLTGIIYNTAIVGFGFLFWRLSGGVAGFAWGVPVGAFLGFFILQIIGCKIFTVNPKDKINEATLQNSVSAKLNNKVGTQTSSGIKYFFEFKPTHPEFIKTLKLLAPMILGAGSMFTLEFVIRSFGGMFGSTGISTLNYAYRLMYTLVAVFGFSVGAAKYPDMVRMFKSGETALLNKKIYEDLSKIFAILVPAICALCAVSLPAVRILFERGAFNSANSQAVSGLLLCYLPASIGLCAQSYLVRAFYACERMWLPTIINTLTFAISIFLYKPISEFIGIYSVPAVSSLCAFIQIGVLILFWKKYYGGAGLPLAAVCKANAPLPPHSSNKPVLIVFLRSMLSLCAGVPIGLFIANKFRDWLLNANLIYLILYSIFVSAAFFSPYSVSIIKMLKKRISRK